MAHQFESHPLTGSGALRRYTARLISLDEKCAERFGEAVIAHVLQDPL
jgi:hypothetical protein